MKSTSKKSLPQNLSYQKTGYVQFPAIGSAVILLVIMYLAGNGQVVNAQSSMAATPHNLTPSGPGTVKETAASGMCVFCHTPHNANPTRGLWNRELPGVTYKLYQSSTLQAVIDQPTGDSRLCLSCHDGLLALGNVRVPADNNFSLDRLTGANSLGTDLSDDHPVSLHYDNSLAALQGELADPMNLEQPIKLDENQDLQCSTCHDPHEAVIPKFLRMDNRFGKLCTVCHTLPLWNDSSHATSSATWTGTGSGPWPQDGYTTVAENACLNCHRPHGAGHPEWLLAQSDEPGNCINCHDGESAEKDIKSQFLKTFHHPIENNQGTHQPNESPAVMQPHVSCSDCHDPHATNSGVSTDLAISGTQRNVSGVTVSGSVAKPATFKYEVCLKCHGLQEPATLGIIRAGGTRNIRLKIDPNNPSYHPVAAQGKNQTINGLDPEFTSSSQIDCIDCHNNDEWTAGGTQPRGPHGSNYEPILTKQYQAGDPATESTADYALCYSCHERTTLLTSGNFPHNSHVVTDQASCAVCHDAHGSRDNKFLIDFMLQSKLGAPVVTDSSGGQLQFVPDPVNPGHGSCSLTCHGHDHNPSSY